MESAPAHDLKVRQSNDNDIVTDTSKRSHINISHNSHTGTRSYLRRLAVRSAILLLLYWVIVEPTWNHVWGIPGRRLYPWYIRSLFPSPSYPVSPAKGWHTRAVPFGGEGGNTRFKPAKEDLIFTVLVNSMGDPDGFTMALLTPNITVDASGRVQTITHDDFIEFQRAIGAVKTVPRTQEGEGGSFSNWDVKHDVTCRSFSSIVVPDETNQTNEKGGRRWGVYGWDQTATLLERRTKGYWYLPEPLQTFLGLAEEGYDDFAWEKRDMGVIRQVRALMR